MHIKQFLIQIFSVQHTVNLKPNLIESTKYRFIRMLNHGEHTTPHFTVAISETLTYH